MVSYYLHYFIACYKAVHILPSIEGHCQYQICVTVAHNNYLLVSTAGMGGEATCVISIQFTDRHDLDKEFV